MICSCFLDYSLSAFTQLFLSGLGNISQAGSSLFNTGVSPDLAFEQLNDPSIFDFFSPECAADLDTVPAAVSDDDDDFVGGLYEQSRAEFFAIINGGGE